MWFAKNCAAMTDARKEGEAQYCRWSLHDDTSLIGKAKNAEEDKAGTVVHLDKTETERLRQRLFMTYPFEWATGEPAKTSVSVLRRRAMELLENEEAVEIFRSRSRRADLSELEKSSAEIGTVHHRFLERVSLERVGAVKELRSEAERMVKEHVLSDTEVDALNFDSLAEFWRSEFGQKIVANAQHVRRELAFTARFPHSELGELAPDGSERKVVVGEEISGDDFVVVQGVADLAVILAHEIWLLDFKTDAVLSNDVAHKARIYEPQLKLYARALERIYRRPVTECRLHFLSCGKTVALPGCSN
jgi:ATP-dependent helicase/nuclease subunit A